MDWMRSNAILRRWFVPNPIARLVEERSIFLSADNSAAKFPPEESSEVSSKQSTSKPCDEAASATELAWPPFPTMTIFPSDFI